MGKKKLAVKEPEASAPISIPKSNGTFPTSADSTRPKPNFTTVIISVVLVAILSITIGLIFVELNISNQDLQDSLQHFHGAKSDRDSNDFKKVKAEEIPELPVDSSPDIKLKSDIEEKAKLKKESRMDSRGDVAESITEPVVKKLKLEDTREQKISSKEKEAQVVDEKQIEVEKQIVSDKPLKPVAKEPVKKDIPKEEKVPSKLSEKISDEKEKLKDDASKKKIKEKEAEAGLQDLYMEVESLAEDILKEDPENSMVKQLAPHLEGVLRDLEGGKLSGLRDSLLHIKLILSDLKQRLEESRKDKTLKSKDDLLPKAGTSSEKKEGERVPVDEVIPDPIYIAPLGDKERKLKEDNIQQTRTKDTVRVPVDEVVPEPIHRTPLGEASEKAVPTTGKSPTTDSVKRRSEAESQTTTKDTEKEKEIVKEKQIDQQGTEAKKQVKQNEDLKVKKIPDSDKLSEEEKKLKEAHEKNTSESVKKSSEKVTDQTPEIKNLNAEKAKADSTLKEKEKEEERVKETLKEAKKSNKVVDAKQKVENEIKISQDQKDSRPTKVEKEAEKIIPLVATPQAKPPQAPAPQAKPPQAPASQAKPPQAPASQAKPPQAPESQAKPSQDPASQAKPLLQERVPQAEIPKEKATQEKTPIKIVTNNQKEKKSEEKQQQAEPITKTIPSETQEKIVTKVKKDSQNEDKLNLAAKIADENPLEALSIYNSLLQELPKSPQVMLGRAKVLDKLSEKEKSNSRLEQTIQAYTNLLDLTDELVIPKDILKEAGLRCADRMNFRGSSTWTKERKILRLLTKHFKNDITVLNKVGVFYLVMGRNEEAEKVFLNVLNISPEDGFALMHYGFIVKISSKNSTTLMKGINYMEKGLSSDAEGVEDARFYHHLGDGLQRLGQNERAYKVFDRGVAKGMFLSRYQRSTYNVDRLKSKPIWTAKETTYEKFFLKLQSKWKEIKKEGLFILGLKNDRNLGFRHEAENLQETGEWKLFELFARGEKRIENCKLAPVTCSLIENFLPAARCTRGQVKFSVMEPETHVFPHTGPTNCRLRSHLGLVTPNGPRIRVVNQTLGWEEGKLFIFDDSFEHEVWHDGKSARLILIVDVWHPELTETERNSLRPI